MVKVVLKGHVLAESNNTVVVEGNHYFPPDSVSDIVTKDPSNSVSTCPWKGVAHYYNVQVGGKKVHDVAWYYPQPKDAAANIKNHVAFYVNKVEIQQ